MICENQRPGAHGPIGWLIAALVVIAIGPALGGAAVAAQASSKSSQGEVAAGRGPVDRSVLNGYRRYNASCNHCHGPDGIGSSFGPGLIESPVGAEVFRDVVLNGRSSGLSVMKGFANDPNVAPYVDDIYRYLRARTDGRVGRGRPRLDP